MWAREQAPFSNLFFGNKESKQHPSSSNSTAIVVVSRHQFGYMKYRTMQLFIS
jgi:hypothetical protein